MSGVRTWTVYTSRDLFFFFFQAEDGIRDVAVTGVQTCALPIYKVRATRVTDTLEDDLPELAQRASQGDALLVRDLDRAIAHLPSEQRAVLLLVTLEEMSYEEVARALGIPIGTVMSRLSRAREKLRMMMLGQGAAAKLKVVK